MIDIATLQAALVGYQVRLDELSAKMSEIQKRLGQTRGGGDIPTPFAKASDPGRKRVMSASARKRIGAAQKKRWAEFHKAGAAPAKKREMSAAGRKRIIAANRKRWAAFRAAKGAPRKTAKPVARKKPAAQKAVAPPTSQPEQA
jgi:hypothetical protein